MRRQSPSLEAEFFRHGGKGNKATNKKKKNKSDCPAKTCTMYIVCICSIVVAILLILLVAMQMTVVLKVNSAGQQWIRHLEDNKVWTRLASALDKLDRLNVSAAEALLEYAQKERLLPETMKALREIQTLTRGLQHYMGGP